MHPKETPDHSTPNPAGGNTAQPVSSNQRPSHAAKSAAGFKKVKDGRGHTIRGLCVRNGRYYARLQFEDTNTSQRRVRRVPLSDKETKEPVQTVAQAVEALNRLKVNRADNALPVLHRCPKFKDYVKTYLTWLQAGVATGQAQKKSNTIDKEEGILKQWAKDLGAVRLDKIGLRHINARIAKRLEAGKSKRTVKIDIIVLHNLLNHALDDGIINTVPKLGKEARKRLRSEPAKRPLFTLQDLEKLCTAAMDENADGSPVTKNWLEFCDYIRLLAYCGAREQEGLRLRWSDVDFDREQLTIGSDGDTKNKTGRVVDFNPKLKAHLLEMQKRKDSDWLFPSPQRGEKDIHTKTFRESLKLVRAHAARKDPAMATKAFHDCRHLFASYCVMSGIDFMTIASWLGHKDGGVLIGKVYGHLANEHRKAMAGKVNFDPLPNAEPPQNPGLETPR